MEYNEVIRRKSRILAIVLLISIVMRCVANAFYVGVASVIPLGIGGFVIAGILLLLIKKVHPVVMMYLMVFFMSALCVALMVAYPCTTNYLMFFMALFFVVIYEDIRPIMLQSLIIIVCMIVFYFRYADVLAESWTSDAMVMAVIYIISGMLVFVNLSRLTKQQFADLQQASEESEKQSRKSQKLLDEISRSVGVLDQTSSKINDNINVTGEISNEIATATESVAAKANEEVRDVENIMAMVQNGVSQIQEVASSSTEMTEASKHTDKRVQQGAALVSDLSEQMSQLSETMEQAAESISGLSEKSAQIITILGTLDQITSQTNLLSLNASIEAARAGEQGKGFAVVATEIRQLSENSAKFTEEIHQILQEVDDQTNEVQKEILAGRESVVVCAENAQKANDSFESIARNTKKVLDHARNVEGKAQDLEALMGQTLTDVDNINTTVEATSAAMEQISSSIMNLHGNIGSVVEGYQDINEITLSLVDASKQE